MVLDINGDEYVGGKSEQKTRDLTETKTISIVIWREINNGRKDCV